MKLIFLGGSVKVSRPAADLAVAFDKITANPVLAKALLPQIEVIQASVVLLEKVERTQGRARLNELIKTTFPKP